MQSDRFNEIWTAVVVNAFYNVGGAEADGSDISHAEMVELVKLAKKGLK